MFGFIPPGKEARISQEDQTLKFTGDLDLLLILGLTAAEKAEISTEPALPQGTEPQWLPCFIRASGFAQVSSCTHQQKHFQPLPESRGLQILWAHSAQTCLLSARQSELAPALGFLRRRPVPCMFAVPDRAGEQNVCCLGASATGFGVEKRPQH